MIITIDEGQHVRNKFVCSFCDDESKHVIGRAYAQHKYDYPTRTYLFSYCAGCCLKQADKMAKMVHPCHKVI